MQTKTILFTLCIYLFFFNITAHAQLGSKEDGSYNIPITMLDGKQITLNDYVGKKPVYLKFWASWCQPCREQMPHLQKTYEEFGDKIEVITVNLGINDSLDDITAIQEEFSLTAPIAIDDTGKLSQAFSMVGTPYHVLIDIDGNIVFKGNDASSQLDKTIKLLSIDEATELPALSVDEIIAQSAFIDTQTSKTTALFFIATWCDSYFEESRPAMSQNCIAGQNEMNKLAKANPELNWIGVISRLWTGENELKEYQQKYNIEYPLVLDVSDQEFVQYGVKNLPTLILLQAGKEVFRAIDFSDSKEISSHVREFQ